MKCLIARLKIGLTSSMALHKLVPSEAAGSAPSVPLDGDATDSARNDASPTFENTGDPLLLIGRGSGRRGRDDRVVSFDLNSFQ